MIHLLFRYLEFRFIEDIPLKSWDYPLEKALHSRKGIKFRTLLVEARIHAGLTQVEVARRLRKAQSFVSYYEKGLRRLDVIEFIEVAAVLNADPVKIIRQLVDHSPAAKARPTKLLRSPCA